ncbi:MAG: OB-fold nucleic acid binding domain-containing protein, partial [Bacteroidales bacterium]
MERTKVAKVLALEPGREVLVKGWVRTKRESSAVAFIQLNDGSTINSVQIVCDREKFADQLSKITTGACIGAIGNLVASQGSG